MLKNYGKLRQAGIFGVMLLMVSQGASAGVHGNLFGFGYAFSAILRTDIALSTTSEANPNNQFGNPYNEITVSRTAGNPNVSGALNTGSTVGGILGTVGNAAGLDLGGAVDTITNSAAPPFTVDLPGFADSIRRGQSANQSPTAPSQQTKQNTFNYHVIKADLNFDLNLTDNLRFVARLRTLYNVADFEDTYQREKDYDHNTEGGAFRGGNVTYRGKPSQFEYRTDGNSHPLLFEWTGRDYFVDFSALLFEYSAGNLTLRLGNQQIAWGQTIFFRILDKVDGLDLRRHLIIDRALEEFSDERVPSPGLRATYQITNDILVDSFVQQFRPRIYPNTNTPFNVIPSQFTVHDRYTDGDYNKKLNYGVRFKGDYGTYGWQAIYINRYNPAGAFAWSRSNVVRDLPNFNPDGSTNVLGTALNTYCVAQGLGTTGCGETIAKTPLEVAPSGQAVASGDEFSYFGSQAHLNALPAVNAIINDFPAARALLTDKNDNHDQLQRELDAFFEAAGGLRGHIKRDYYRENVFGLGASYVTTADSASFFNQIVINIEASYTPDKKFTPINLGQTPLEDDEFEIALVMEKYYRFTQAFPSTFMVMQILHRSASDIFDFHTSGYNADETKTPTDSGVSTGFNPPNSKQYIALAALQPLPQFVHELSIAALIDVGGGILVQPGYRWKPRTDLTFELFYNYINGHVYGSQSDNNTIHSIDFADEVTVRLSYQF